MGTSQLCGLYHWCVDHQHRDSIHVRIYSPGKSIQEKAHCYRARKFCSIKIGECKGHLVVLEFVVG